MHVLTFLYPSAPGKSFDFRHYFETHLPLGAGLAHKILNIDVSRMIIQKVRGPSEGGIPAPYYVLCHVVLETKEQADTLATIFEDPEAASRLSADWPKYTPVSPQAMLSEWTVLENMEELRGKFNAVLEPAYRAEGHD